MTIPAPETGLVAGTICLTSDGEIPVEYLSAGDKIITRDTGFVRVRQITCSQQVLPTVLFLAGSLGHTRPGEDLILPAGQQVLIRDWRARAMFGTARQLVCAIQLVDGEFVRDLGPQQLLLHQLGFDHPQIIYAGGLEVAAGRTTEPQQMRAA